MPDAHGYATLAELQALPETRPLTAEEAAAFEVEIPTLGAPTATYRDHVYQQDVATCALHESVASVVRDHARAMRELAQFSYAQAGGNTKGMEEHAMALALKGYRSHQRTATFPVIVTAEGATQDVTVTYAPGVFRTPITAERFKKFQGAKVNNETVVSASLDILADLLVDWDVEDDGEPTVPSRVAIGSMDPELLVQILFGVIDDFGKTKAPSEPAATTVADAAREAQANAIQTAMKGKPTPTPIKGKTAAPSVAKPTRKPAASAKG